MDLPASYHELQLQVKQKVHSITSHLVQQLMTIPSVISVQLTGHLDVIVNGCVTVSIVSPSQYLCASGGQSTCTPSAFSDCSVMNMAQSMNSQAANFREAAFGDRSVDGVETPLKDLYGHSQSSLPAPLLNELDNTGQTSTSKQNLSVGCGQTADEFLHSILSSSVLVGGISDHQDFLDISNNTGELTAGSLATLNRCHKKSAEKSKLTSPQQPFNQSSKRSRKRKHPQKFSGLGETVKNEPISVAEVPERSAVSVSMILNAKTATDLECAHCHKIYPGNKRKAYHKHVRSHTQSRQCETCGKYLSSADSLKRHQIGMHRQEKPYRCEQCGERFSFHHSFKLHTYKHSGSRPEVCPHCSKTYLTHNHLKAHMMSAHSKKEKAQGKFQCEVCGRTLGSAASLKSHRFTHTDDKPFHCDMCPKGFSYKSALLLHKKLVHVAGRKFECEVCHKMFKTPQVLNIHKRRHGTQETGQFVCDMCGRRFLFDSNLKAHVAAVHEGICPYSCKDCGKGFKLLSSLYSHRFTHTSERPYQCSLCPKVFKTKSACSAHERRHTASRDFECTHCGAKFPDKGGLDKHTRSIHTPSKVYECTLCGKTGSRMDNMRTHIKSHTGRDKTVEELNTYIKQAKE